MSFIDDITPDLEKARKIKLFNKSPFQGIPIFHGGFQNMYHFNFDRTYVKLSALKKLEKIVKYVPLNEVSPRLTGKPFFTIGCIVDINRSNFVISDLKSTTFSILYGECPVIHKYDFVAIANCEVNITIRTKTIDQIIAIGHCEKITKCSQSESNPNKKCVIHIDPRNGPTCEFHCHQLVMQSANDRPMLKMSQGQMKFQDFSNQIPREKLSGFFQGPQIKLPDDYLEKYFENHKGARLTKISKLLCPSKEDHKIGVGLSKGDVIVF